MQYAIVHNTESNSLVALPSTEVLSDTAFDKGWRVVHQDVDYFALQEWKEKFNLEVMDAARFYLDYLVDTELTEEDTLYIEALMQENFYESSVSPVEENLDDEDVIYQLFEENEDECPHEQVEE